MPSSRACLLHSKEQPVSNCHVEGWNGVTKEKGQSEESELARRIGQENDAFLLG